MNARKSIFITGAASGIGKAASILFSRKGWYVGLYDSNLKGLAALGGEIGAESCCYRQMDVSDPESVKKAVHHFSKFTGGAMNVLFNNAGILKMGPHEAVPIEDQFRIIDVNLKGVLNCIHVCLPLLKNTDGARIVNMSSGSSLYGTAHLAVYSATKAAVSSLTESLNLELEKYGIFVCDVRAPFVRTPLLDQETQAPVINRLGVNLSAEEVAGTVWKTVHRKKVHNDTKGIRPLMFLLMFPDFILKKILRYLLLP